MPLGDLNGDGYADFGLGLLSQEPVQDSSVFQVYMGQPNGIASTYITLTGDGTQGAGFGAAADSGDIDGDGYPDVVVGEGYANGSRGGVYIYRGGPAGLAAAPAWVIQPPAVDGGVSGVGASAIVVADFDGDGYDDIATTGTVGSVASTFVFRGGPTGPNLTTPDLVIPLSGNLASPMDANGDGYADLVIATTSGAPLQFFAGSASGLPKTYSLVLNAPSSSSGLPYVAN